MNFLYGNMWVMTVVMKAFWSKEEGLHNTQIATESYFNSWDSAHCWRHIPRLSNEYIFNLINYRVAIIKNVSEKTEINAKRQMYTVSQAFKQNLNPRQECYKLSSSISQHFSEWKHLPAGPANHHILRNVSFFIFILIKANKWGQQRSFLICSPSWSAPHKLQC